MLQRLATAVRQREVSSEALVNTAIQRIEKHNEKLNAVVVKDYERALDRARHIDEQILAGEDVGALAGLPLLVKDCEDVAGLRTTFGSMTQAQAAPARRSGMSPTRLMAAGAVVVGKTNTPEYTFEAYTSNRLFGPTRNPWNTDWNTGGSSGGSAAALASGLAPLATATDGGGSIRIPSALCGLVGLKPTTGVVPRSPIPSWIDLSTDGPLGVSVDDVELLLELMSGPVDGDPNALPRGSLAEPDGYAGIRLLFSERTYDWGALPTELQSVFAQCVTDLSDILGVPSRHVPPRELIGKGNPDTDWFILCSVEQAHHLGRHFILENAELFDPTFYQHMLFGLAQGTDRYLEARRARFSYTADIDRLLGSDGILLTPTLGVRGFAADGTAEGAIRPVTDPPALNTVLQNITGHPALSLPAGILENGLPFGMQLTGPRGSDRLLLDIGRKWEADRPWPLAAPGYDPFALDKLEV